MSNENHTEQHGGWEPTPQSGEYDADATAFVHLPPEDLANIPLAAPGQGYVPPMILPLTPAAGLDPAATGSWAAQTPDQRAQPERGTQTERPAPEAVHWPDPNQQQTPYGYPQTPHQPQASGEQYPDRYRENPADTGQWNFAESAEATGHTGQWQIPVADGDLPEESGEFSASALAAGWYAERTPPATLPGGAPAPWATREPEPAAGDDTPPQGTDPGGAPDAPDGAAEGDVDAAAPLPEPSDGAHETAHDAAHEVPPEATLQDAPQHGTEHPGTAEPVAEAAPDAGTAPDAEATDAESAPEAEAADTGAVDADAMDLGAADPDAAPAAALDLPSEHPSASYVLHVNGADRPVTDAWIGESLLYVLRERLGLAGAKDGCSQGECGACNVQVDGRLVASCLVPAATAAGSEVRTVEGLAVDGEPSDVQRALADCGAVQCGFCIPGMAMTVHDLLEGNHAPSELETRQALCGNLCRCSGYRGVLDAVNEVIAGREAAAEAASAPAPESAEQDEARIPHQAAPGAGSVQAHLQDGGMA
ncbi:2Fe-2S iron-sulfur cluster-binding protein [Streptomyces sp. NBC_01260]|uniref:2Fe-2S iron-sulfur cluster-binding protein n=1 Tax=Streptomyces sp. NBC_01260 TaxID=2903801 RepID=UPI002E37466F|nr:2Fe-2S iron-sulfur cluster-binding protein [Streptomyces sp. NBC_01260]